MTDTATEELERLLAAATDGPWSHASDKIAAGNIKAPNNAALIVALRNAAPSLIASLKAVTAERDELKVALADERAGAEILDEAGMDAGDKIAVVSAHLKELCEMVIHLDLVTTYGLRTKDYARECEKALEASNA